MRRYINKLTLLFVLTFISYAGSSIVNHLSASAAVLSTYNQQLLIVDGLFTNSSAMSAQDVQNFLVSKNSGLQNYSDVENCSSIKQPYSGNYYPHCGTSQSAATIIYDAGQAYGVSQKAILAILQKEQSLVTTPNPVQAQLNYAMGYGCPDSGSCSYPGFFNQVDNGVWQLRLDMELGSSHNWWGYSPSSYACPAKPGSDPWYYDNGLYPGRAVNFSDGNDTVYTNMTIQNISTAALYCYTPHAYNNPNGINGMPAYGTTGQYYSGSYNFVTSYTQWFGPTTSVASGITMRNISQPDTTPALGQTISYTISLTNNLADNVTIDAVGIVGRFGDVNTGSNRDFGWQGPITLAPGVPQQFTFTTLVQDKGTLYVWPAIYAQGSYTHYNNWGAALTTHVPNISVTVPLSSTLQNPIASQTGTLSATIKNNEDQSIRLDTVGIPVRYFGQYNYDTPWAGSPISLAAGGTQSLSGNLTFDKPGPYSAWISAMIGGQFVTISPTLNIITAAAVPNFQLSYIETPDSTPALGEDVKVKFKLKNNSGVGMTLDAVGVVGRYDNPYNGANRDFGWVGPETFAAGEEKSYTTFVSNVSDLKNFYAWVAIVYKGSYIHYNNWGFMMSPHLPNLTTSSPLTINSGNQPTVGQTVSITATIKNNEANPIKFSALGIPARYYGVYNYDVTWQGPGTLAASGQSGDSINLSGNINFDKAGTYTIWPSINIQGRYIVIGTQNNINL